MINIITKNIRKNVRKLISMIPEYKYRFDSKNDIIIQTSVQVFDSIVKLQKKN